VVIWVFSFPPQQPMTFDFERVCVYVIKMVKQKIKVTISISFQPTCFHIIYSYMYYKNYLNNC